ncbi:hypothetical protein [Marinobacter segnicrescens]|uniref:hypothetical protein n=1 Tax=Marinobacter segnicrescens TaxID=430453 RepID=UPI003A8E2C9D
MTRVTNSLGKQLFEGALHKANPFSAEFNTFLQFDQSSVLDHTLAQGRSSGQNACIDIVGTGKATGDPCLKATHGE